MSKTFKSAVTNRTLTVEGFFNGAFSVVFSDNSSRDLMLQGDDAPALALAILEAAGYSEESHGLMEYVVGNLREAVRCEAERTAEAKEQAELEAEALELANSAVLVVRNPPYPSIRHMSATSLRKWLAVARKAREMRKP